MIISALATSEKALVLVDELGRGTSPQEGEFHIRGNRNRVSHSESVVPIGVGIAHAIAEEIIRSKVSGIQLLVGMKNQR